ncbi:MAG: PAS-domain containing protein [Alphaproteobacteria bacterium]
MPFDLSDTPHASAQTAGGFAGAASDILATANEAAPGHGWAVLERPSGPRAHGDGGWRVVAWAGRLPDREALAQVGARLFASLETWPADGFDLTGRPVWRWASHRLGRAPGTGQRALGFALRAHADAQSYPALAYPALAYPMGALLVISPSDAMESPPTAVDVARRLEHEARALQQSENRRLLAAAAESMAQGIAVADLSCENRTIRHCNRAFERLTGLGTNGSIAMHGPLFARAEMDEATRDGLSRALRAGTPFTVNLGLAQARGDTLWCEIGLSSLDPDGSGRGHLVMTVTDMSARRHGEDERIRMRQLLLDAIESTSEGFMLLDRRERIVLVNNRYRELYPGIADRLQAGEPFADVLHAMAAAGLSPRNTDRRRWIRNQLERLRAPGDGTLREETLPDGRVIRVSDRPTASGGTVSTRTDITALRRADDLSRLRLHAIEASLDGIAICDVSGRIVYANAAMANLLAHDKAGDLTGRPLSALRDDSERLRFEVEVLPALDRERYWRGQAKGRRCDGADIRLDMTLTKLDDGSVVCAARDMTEQVRAEKERTTLQARFFQAQKMEAIGQLAGGIAHDFNNILSSILGYASFLTEDLEPGSELHGFAETILHSGQRAKSLVSQILTFSRNEPAQRRAGDLVASVEEAAEMLKATLPPGIRFETILDCPTALARFDSTQINQVLMNLCVNARDAMDGEGALKIILSWEKPADAEPIVRRTNADGASDGPDIRETGDGTLWLSTGALEHADGYYRITVEDSGSGMPRSVMERMFEPFFTTKDKHKGTGLGLAAVHGIVLAHGGRIDIRSRAGLGTAFALTLPACAAERIEGGTGPLRDGRGEEHVMVVDDNGAVAEMTRQGLERLGYTVTTAHGAGEALALLEEGGTPVDLVVTDQTMPGMTGLQLVAALRAGGVCAPVILYTGYAGEIDEAAVRSAGADAFLRKPFEPLVLARMMRVLLDKETETGDLLFDLSA